MLSAYLFIYRKIYFCETILDTSGLKYIVIFLQWFAELSCFPRIYSATSLFGVNSTIKKTRPIFSNSNKCYILRMYLFYIPNYITHT